MDSNASRCLCKDPPACLTAYFNSRPAVVEVPLAEGSRRGLRGKDDLGSGISAIFTIEGGFSSGDGSISQGGALFGRQGWVGLDMKGIGSLTLGRQYTFSRDYVHSYATAHETPAGNYAYHVNDLEGQLRRQCAFSGAGACRRRTGGNASQSCVCEKFEQKRCPSEQPKRTQRGTAVVTGFFAFCLKTALSFVESGTWVPNRVCEH